MDANVHATWGQLVSVAGATLLVCYVASRFMFPAKPPPGPRDIGQPPAASGVIPVLGHALAYKRDPAKFLTAQHKASNGAFRLNLAGLRTTVVCDEAAVRQVVTAPESVLSERQGVADFGFLEALGDLNVYVAVSAHKRILKSSVYLSDDTVRAELITHTQAAIGAVVLPESADGDGARTMDLLPTLRRIFLRVTVAFAVGPKALELCPSFIEDYMHFQDRLEDAIAAAAVLPAWLASPLKLRTIQQMRESLRVQLAGAITTLWLEDEKAAARGPPDSSSCGLPLLGTWLRELKGASLEGLPGWADYVAFREETGRPMQPREARGDVAPSAAAEIIISLLFAAHKNPSIGAGQALLMALEHPGQMALVEAEVEELRSELPNRQPGGESDCKFSISALGVPGLLETRAVHLGRCISEACRLTAHTIGAIRKVMAAEGFMFTCGRDGPSYWVPQGAYVAVSHVAVSLDEQVFPQASAFVPERFTANNDGDGLVSHAGLSEYEYTTFSQGLHRCPGQRLAMVMMKTVLLALLVRFRVEPVGALPPVDFSRATLAQRAGPCMLRFTPRDEAP